MTRLRAQRGGCAIRMYRHGLGDCFLLAFANGASKQHYVLVDFGVLLGTGNANQTMGKVARDIKSATGNHVHRLVITHEHWDHISGFHQAKDELEDLKIDELWLAWTEDPNDGLAKILRDRKRRAIADLHAVNQKMVERGLDENSTAVSALRFFGNIGASGRAGTEDIMNSIKQQWREESVFLSPGGAPIKIEGLPDLSVFVLGPPRDQQMIKKSRPSSAGHETYLFAPIVGSENQYLLPARAGDDTGFAGAADTKAPFNPRYNLSHDETGIYVQDDWRAVDSASDTEVGELALRLDAHTNNTSLVLAFELSENGSVLLFPADAQVGNWLSWSDVSWADNRGPITSDDLLERTVFYKVGHHASHNATLREQGLEKMTHPNLTAFIPLDRKMAKKQKWRMPHPALYERLKAQTEGRVLISDETSSPVGDFEITDLYAEIHIQR
ncbi:MAG: hypothetical protein ACTS1Z_14560 [Parasphingopyxis sp.]|uniref:hypothetical protein n=1 Tax=Parasphingopyxis sp. TaxID=1920299 RepID=UPI003F9EF014